MPRILDWKMYTDMADYATSEIVFTEEQSRIAGSFWSKAFSGLTAVTYREKGSEAVNDLWRRFLGAHQTERYEDGLRRLGIDLNVTSPAAVAAQYHYFTNIIGGLEMEYVEESPKKVWIRYLGPMWTYPGIALLAMPANIRRTTFSSWHPYNGVYMGCPRLGYVGTKFISEGDPYDEGYFCEYEHDLRPHERMRFEVAASTPEFEPDRAPVLDPTLWPLDRILKARPKFSSRYFRTTLEVLERLHGVEAADYLATTTMRMVAVQYAPELQRAAGITGRDASAVAQFVVAVISALRIDFSYDTRSDGAHEIKVNSWAPFDAPCRDGLRAAVFEFFRSAARMTSGRIAATRSSAGETDIWTFSDAGRWLW